MLFRMAADLVLALHLGFIVFVILGGLLVLRYRWFVYLHIPAAAWGAFVEISGRICPLTTWENSLRRSAGESGYAQSFVEHYLVPIIYPAGLTRSVQFAIAALVFATNIAIYGWLLLRWRNREFAPTIRVAAHSEAAAISSLAIRSKAHWGYSDEFMEACREELTWSESQIDSPDYEFYVYEAEGRIAGFYALEHLGPGDAELEALFVEPDMIGRGYGRTLIEHAKGRASALGIRRITIQGDPNAESFYKAAGGVRDGQRESSSIPGRFLPIFRIDL